jgi:hypothetical protein
LTYPRWTKGRVSTVLEPGVVRAFALPRVNEWRVCRLMPSITVLLRADKDRFGGTRGIQAHNVAARTSTTIIAATNAPTIVAHRGPLMTLFAVIVYSLSTFLAGRSSEPPPSCVHLFVEFTLLGDLIRTALRVTHLLPLTG